MKTHDPKKEYILLLVLGLDSTEQSPLAKSKTDYNSNMIVEDQPVLSAEERGHLRQKLNRLNERQPAKDILVIPGKPRAASLDDEILSKNAAPRRPGLKRRPFSAGVGLADFDKQCEELTEGKLCRGESVSAHDENLVIDSEYSKVVETVARKTSPEILVTHCHGKESPNRKNYVAISSFFGEESGEVSLEKGEEVDVLQKESSGWWYVKNDFCEGWAPKAFLAPTGSRSPSPEMPDQQQVSNSQEEPRQIKEKSVETRPKEKVADQIKFTTQGKEQVPIILLM